MRACSVKLKQKDSKANRRAGLFAGAMGAATTQWAACKNLAERGGDAIHPVPASVGPAFDSTRKVVN